MYHEQSALVAVLRFRSVKLGGFGSLLGGRIEKEVMLGIAGTVCQAASPGAEVARKAKSKGCVLQRESSVHSQHPGSAQISTIFSSRSFLDTSLLVFE